MGIRQWDPTPTVWAPLTELTALAMRKHHYVKIKQVQIPFVVAFLLPSLLLWLLLLLLNWWQKTLRVRTGVCPWLVGAVVRVYDPFSFLLVLGQYSGQVTSLWHGGSLMALLACSLYGAFLCFPYHQQVFTTIVPSGGISIYNHRYPATSLVGRR